MANAAELLKAAGFGLEHVVDTVLQFEGDRHHALRLLRASKHRFGPTNELGLFEMAGTGLIAVPDASSLFLADRRTGVPGSAVVPTMEGQRPIVVEVQALVAVRIAPDEERGHAGAIRSGVRAGCARPVAACHAAPSRDHAAANSSASRHSCWL